MLRFVLTLLFFAACIALVLMAGTVLLPVVAVLFVIWLIAAVFRPRRSEDPDEDPDEAGLDDIPASQAVIDVEAVAVSDDDAPPETDRKSG